MLAEDLTGRPITTAAARPLVATRDEARGADDVELPVQQHSVLPAQQLQTFGRRVRRTRQNRDWSIRKLQKRSGVDRGLLSRIEGGKNVTLDVLWRLANGLGVHWADLLDDRTTEPAGDQPAPIPLEQQLAAFGARLYKARVRQHLSQPDLAARAAVGRSTIFTVESGAGNIRLDTLLRLAAGLGVHPANLLDDRPAAPPRPQSRLHEALGEARQLRAEVNQLRAELTLAQARAQVAKRVAEQTATRQITSTAAQARLVIDRYDRRILAALSKRHVAAHVDGRRALYDYFDRMRRDGQRHRLDHRPEWTSVVVLHELTQHLMSNALDEQLHRD
jgi:transcriptional regulator with XRE-family HTH domain